MGILIQFILIMAIFFPINYAAYWITEVRGLPQWLQYKPWVCRLCLTFWTLIFTYSAIWLSFSCLYLGIGGVILASMNALAMWIDQKQKTVTLEDYDSLKGKEVDCDEIEIDDDDNIIIHRGAKPTECLMPNGEIIDFDC